ncbi:MAG: proton-conducting transporter membrane subunit [Halovenus sp.]
MEQENQMVTVGQLPAPTAEKSRVPAVLTRLVWLLWVVSLGMLAVQIRGGTWELAGLVAVDGLTGVMWAAVTFFSGIVHSYSRRYMAGSRTLDRFFGRVFAFTLVVIVLVAADSLVLFGTAWLAMGLLMADLIGHVDGWPQAQAAAALARRYFLASSALLTVALVTLWWHTGATTVSGVASGVGTTTSTVVLFAASALLLSAMVQSALVPFQTWLLSSMTAPTPASALMHAGFVNAGGILLVRFAPVVTVDASFMLVIVLVGAASALFGKLLKSVQVDVKTRLGCSTVGQMGFMIMQAGLGFFGAAVTHLVLHGFYKAYLFLSAGEEVEHTSPADTTHATASTGPVGLVVAALAALAGGALFAGLTGKGTSLDSGLLLTGLVVLTTMHATRSVLEKSALPVTDRYGAVPLVFLPAIAVYAAVYVAVRGVMAGVVTAPAELTVVHGVVAAAFLVAYIAIETGIYRDSDRLYVALVNATRPASGTSLTSMEEYNEY